MISLPDIETLIPQSFGDGLYYFQNDATQLVKLDLIYAAGSVFQSKPLCSAATNRLAFVAGGVYDAERFAEFLDYRGIIVERNPQLYQSGYSVYFLRKYADELLPAIADVLSTPQFGEKEFQSWCAKRYQQLLTAQRKTREVARKSFYQALFPQGHPLAAYAEPEDVQRLQINDIEEFYREQYLLGPCNVVLAGNVDDTLLGLFSDIFKTKRCDNEIKAIVDDTCQPSCHHVNVSGAVQTSLYVGRVLPLRWDDVDYARFLILTTALGGYFGSRLMSNVREDKGYTYGIYARTQVYRGNIVFQITADVSNGVVDAARDEIFNEIKRLAVEPMPDDELEMVKTVMVGDFLRSVDGVFEQSARFCDMIGANIDERFTQNLQLALKQTDAVELVDIARRLMRVEDMTVCSAGGK